MRISFNLLGTQGSGKGTQADALLERYDFIHFDLGENLRQIASSGSELGRELAQHMNVGRRVPASLIAEVTREKLEPTDPSKDILFDGILRALDELTVQWATLEALDLSLPVIIFLNLDEETAVKRLSARRLCSACRARYRLEPGQAMTKCRRCGGQLMTRSDDTPEAIRKRLDWYHDDTLPVIDYFRTRGTVIDIDASPEVEVVTTEIVTKIEAYYRSIGKTAPRQ